MKTNEFGHTLYSPQELQEAFKNLQSNIDNNSRLRNNMDNEAYNSIHTIANYEYSAPVEQPKKNYSFLISLLLVAIIGCAVYFGYKTF